jgi:predicted XRE-type DNA-binding protein
MTDDNTMNETMTNEGSAGEGVFASSGNVFADLGLPEPEARLAKAKLAYAIRSRIHEYGLNQTQAADRLGITQARVSELMNGKISKMSYELLLDYLNALDCDVQITVLPRRLSQPAATRQDASPVAERGHVLVA